MNIDLYHQNSPYDPPRDERLEHDLRDAVDRFENALDSRDMTRIGPAAEALLALMSSIHVEVHAYGTERVEVEYWRARAR